MRKPWRLGVGDALGKIWGASHRFGVLIQVGLRLCALTVQLLLGFLHRPFCLAHLSRQRSAGGFAG